MEKSKWKEIDALNRATFGNQDGGFTVEEYAQRYKLNQTTASHRLTSLAKSGVLKAGWRYILDTSNRKRMVRVYVTP